MSSTKSQLPVVITRVDHVAPTTPLSSAGSKHATRRRSMRTFPKGILKRGGGTTIKAVRDPAKAPPSRKLATKGTLRILTEKGMQKRRSNIKKTVKNMSDAKVRETLKNSKMAVNDKTPPHIARDILEGGMEAGMIVVK